MTTLNDIRYFLGCEFDNYFDINELDNLKHFLIHSVLMKELSLTELNEYHPILDDIITLLNACPDIVSFIPPNSNIHINRVTLYTAAIYYFFYYPEYPKTISDTKYRYRLSKSNLLEDTKYGLVDNDLSPYDIKEIRLMLENVYNHSNILKINDISPTSIKIFHDIVRIYRLKELPKVLLSEFQYTLDIHPNDMNTFTSERFWNITYNRLVNSSLDKLYYSFIINSSTYGSYLSDLKYILSSYEIFTEYINIFISNKSINNLSLNSNY